MSGFARRPQCLLRWHFCSRSADARAILTPKDAKLCCMFSPFLGRVSRDYFIWLSVIINYDFDLSVFIFPKSGVKTVRYVLLQIIKESFSQVFRPQLKDIFASVFIRFACKIRWFALMRNKRIKPVNIRFEPNIAAHPIFGIDAETIFFHPEPVLVNV